MMHLSKYYVKKALITLCAFSPIILLSNTPEPRQLETNLSPGSPHAIEYIQLTNTWLQALNPSGISLANIPDMGTSFFYHEYVDGGFYRPQEAEKINLFGFFTERYQSINNLKLRGAFSFENIWEKNRKWGVVTDPFRGTPYIFADRVGGDWSKQYYNLNMTASSGKLFDLFYAGIETHYELHTGARQNDPRPLNNTSEIRVSPGIWYPVNDKNFIGLNGFYSNRNEEIDIVVNNRNIHHTWYKMRGVGGHFKGIMTEFDRTYNEHAFGGAMQFKHTLQSGEILAETSYSFLKENVIDDASKRQSGGAYEETAINGTITLNIISGKGRHIAKAYYSRIDKRGREHSQQYDYTQQRWSTFATTLRYRGDRYNAGLQYNFFEIRNRHNDYHWMTGLHAELTAADQRFLLPHSSQLHTSLQLKALGKYNMDLSGNNLHLALSAGYKLPFNENLDLHPEFLNTAETNMIDMVFVADFDYLAQAHTMFKFDVIYDFKLSNDWSNHFFIGIKAEKYYLLNEENRGGHFFQNGRNFFNASLGIVY